MKENYDVRLIESGSGLSKKTTNNTPCLLVQQGEEGSVAEYYEHHDPPLPSQALLYFLYDPSNNMGI